MRRDEEIDRLQRQDVEWGAGRAEPAQPVQSLLEPGAESGVNDEEDAMVGEVELLIDETAPAEEAAIRIVDEPPGASDEPDPGYVPNLD